MRHFSTVMSVTSIYLLHKFRKPNWCNVFHALLLNAFLSRIHALIILNSERGHRNRSPTTPEPPGIRRQADQAAAAATADLEMYSVDFTFPAVVCISVSPPPPTHPASHTASGAHRLFPPSHVRYRLCAGFAGAPTTTSANYPTPVRASTVCGYGQLRPDPRMPFQAFLGFAGKPSASRGCEDKLSLVGRCTQRRQRTGRARARHRQAGAERHYPHASAVRIFLPSTRLGDLLCCRTFRHEGLTVVRDEVFKADGGVSG